MGVLSARARKHIKKSKFGIPSKAPGSGSYPMPDIAHARNALARVAQHGTPSEIARVRAKAYRLYPRLKKRAQVRKAAKRAITKNKPLELR